MPDTGFTPTDVEQWDKLLGKIVEDDVKIVAEVLLQDRPELAEKVQREGRDVYEATIWVGIARVAEARAKALLERHKRAKRRF